MRATPLKIHNFKKIQGAKNKKIKKIFVWKNVFFNAYIILKDNQILKNKHFFNTFLIQGGNFMPELRKSLQCITQNLFEYNKLTLSIKFPSRALFV